MQYVISNYLSIITDKNILYYIIHITVNKYVNLVISVYIMCALTIIHSFN